MAMRLVLASNNAKKLGELRDLLAGVPVELVSQGELGISEADEPHHTFLENALAKARHASLASGLPAVADDSGLCVDALGGEPGVQSAVFAPFPASPPSMPPSDALDREARRRLQDDVNNALLLERLQGVADRRARFVSTLVAVRHAHDPEPLVAFGRWDGLVLERPDGRGGFGYDPLMFIPALDSSVAQLPAARKNRHSHRALAAAALAVLLHEVWQLG